MGHLNPNRSGCYFVMRESLLIELTAEFEKRYRRSSAELKSELSAYGERVEKADLELKGLLTTTLSNQISGAASIHSQLRHNEISLNAKYKDLQKLYQDLKSESTELKDRVQGWLRFLCFIMLPFTIYNHYGTFLSFHYESSFCFFMKCFDKKILVPSYTYLLIYQAISSQVHDRWLTISTYPLLF